MSLCQLVSQSLRLLNMWRIASICPLLQGEFYIACRGNIFVKKICLSSPSVSLQTQFAHLLYVIRHLSANNVSLTLSVLQANVKQNTVPSCWLCTRRIQMPSGCFVATIAMLTMHLLLHDTGNCSELLYCTNVKPASHNLKIRNNIVCIHQKLAKKY